MKSRIQAYVLGGLLLVLAGVVVREFGSGGPVATRGNAGVFTPIDVADPTLRLDDIAASQKREYAGSGRNIFAYGRAVQTAAQTGQQTAPVQPVNTDPPKPPPLTAPFKFYGTALNPANGRRRAFFTNGDDIWIVEEGQMIDRRFKLVKIGNTNAEVQEASSGERVMLPLEELPGGAG